MQHAEIERTIADKLRAHPRRYWIERLSEAGVPCGSVRDLHEVFTDPQLTARDMISVVEHAAIGPVRLLGVPVKLSDTPASVRTAPPTLGQHTNAVLCGDLGMTGQAVAELRARGVI